MPVNTIECTPGQLNKLLAELYNLKLAAFIWGEPGVGKSESVAQFAKQRSMRLEDVRLTQMDAPDLRGLQWVNEETKTTTSYRPEFFPVDNVPGIIFLDELTAAEPRMQATAYQLVLDRRIGPHILPDKWMVIGAGNGTEDGAISFKMGSALADRFIHISVRAIPDDWIKWAIENEIHPTVISFIRVKPEYLTSVAGQAKGANLITPSPRSWARVSKVMQRVQDPVSNSILLNGIIGEAAAVEFKHITEEIAELPTMESLLGFSNAKAAAKQVPNKIACLYGLAYSMSAYVQEAWQIDRAMFIFDSIRSQKGTNLPVAEIETLANELILAKALKLGIIEKVVALPGYKNYAPRAKEICC